MSFSLFLARRFRTAHPVGGQHKSSAPAVTVATAGVAVGLAVMLVAVAVAKGFQQEVRNKITGFGSHIEVLDMASFQSPEDFPVVADEPFLDSLAAVPSVTHLQRVSQKMGILKTNEHFTAICLKGVGEDFDASFMKSSLVAGEWPAFSDKASSNNIVLSKRMATELGLRVGQRVYAYFFEDVVKMRRFTICGLYDTNLSQFDGLFVFADRHTVSQLNGWQPEKCSTVEILTRDFDRSDAPLEQIRQIMRHHTDTAHAQPVALSVRLDPRAASTFQWIDLLDFDIVVVLVLMLLVAGFTMISGMLILILERVQTIGVLKAVGATDLQLRRSFLWLAAMILGRGMLIGNALGLGLILIQHLWAPLRLDPASYYVEQVPVLLTPWWWLALNVGTLLLTVAALILPSHAVSRVQPAKAIRFE